MGGKVRLPLELWFPDKPVYDYASVLKDIVERLKIVRSDIGSLDTQKRWLIDLKNKLEEINISKIVDIIENAKKDERFRSDVIKSLFKLGEALVLLAWTGGKFLSEECKMEIYKAELKASELISGKATVNELLDQLEIAIKTCHSEIPKAVDKVIEKIDKILEIWESP